MLRDRASRQALEPGRRRAVHLEFVGVPDRLLTLAVQHPDLVGQMQDQVALPGRALAAQPHRLELEGQVIAERPVQAQMRVGAAERRRDLPQRAEHRGPPAALLLGEVAAGFRDGHRVLVDGFPRPGHGRADHRQQHPAAVVQGPRGDPPPGGDDLGARVGVGHMPAAVPPGILHAGAHHAAAALVHERRDPVELSRVERGGGADNPHAAAGRQFGAVGVHVAPPGFGPGRRPEKRKNGRRFRAVASVSLCCKTARISGPPTGGATTAVLAWGGGLLASRSSA